MLPHCNLSPPIFSALPANDPRNRITPLIIAINIHPAADLRVDRGCMIKKCSLRKILMLPPAAAIIRLTSRFFPLSRYILLSRGQKLNGSRAYLPPSARQPMYLYTRIYARIYTCVYEGAFLLITGQGKGGDWLRRNKTFWAPETIFSAVIFYAGQFCLGSLRC